VGERTEVNVTQEMGSAPSAGGSEDEVSETIDYGLDSSTAALQDVRNVGRYPVLNKIGEGGMGVVFACFDEELDRRIAIKILTAEAGARAKTRIVREAQAMAKLSHPNVVHVYETGEYEGHIYVAMEYVKGPQLNDWIAAEQRSLEERLEVVLAAGEGLVAAHQAGIIHRDFKPENVMIGHDGRARVLDFGLARSHEDVDEDLSSTLDSQLPERAGNVLSDQLTQHGAIMGTPLYMSPEQHHGLPTDTSSDQFNFCVVLYEALYGELPFEGETRVALAFATRQGEVKEPPAGSRVPGRWREILLRGLRPEPRDRWPSMRDLIDELRRVAFPPDRKPLYITLGVAAAAIVAAVVFGLLFFLGGPTQAQLSEVERLAEAARVASSRAQWVYPDEASPEDTALRHVTTLHELDGELDAEGEARATELSDEFASTLTRLGDEYWEAPGGKVFARDFYAQALLFDPTLEQVRERSGFLPAELADLRSRAQVGEFSEEEMAAADELAELAEPLIDPVAAAPPSAELARKVEEVKTKAKRRRKKRHTDGSPPVEVASVDVPTQVEPVGPPMETGETGETGEPPVEAETDASAELTELAPGEEVSREQARAAAKALVKEANKLKRQGKRDAALKKLFQATKIDRRHAPAWDALRDLHFQIGAYQEAAGYGEKAVKYQARNGRYHLRLGEAYWKLHDYDQAESAWKQAQSLGVEQATQRLNALRKKLGR
jgi:serine/threonine protein kinase/tetratricopeptide (TPR) repeat protein